MIIPPELPPSRFRENTVTIADEARKTRISESLTSAWNRNASPREEGNKKPQITQTVRLGIGRRGSDKSGIRRPSQSEIVSESPKQSFSPLHSPKLSRSRDRIAVGLAKQKAKVKNTFANIFSRRQPYATTTVYETTGSYVRAPESPKVSPRRHIVDLTQSLAETKSRITTFYDELAKSITKFTLTIEEKKKRIATYIGAVAVILKAEVCHGDLKPENILWDDTGFVISDFCGAIFIDDMCKLMNREFLFASEDEKMEMRNLLHLLTAVNPKPIDKDKYNESLYKLVSWDILSTRVLDHECTLADEIADQEKLQKLTEYLATKFLPDGTEGYGSTQYRIAMCHYFWRCEAKNFKNACKALDMRAAALTIYAILTATHPPKNENDNSFYSSLERKLRELGFSERAASILRAMATPTVPPLGTAFILPVSLEDLEFLEDEFHPKKLALGRGTHEFVDEERKQLEQMQQALKRFTLSRCDSSEDIAIRKQLQDDEQKIQDALVNLLDSLSDDEESEDEEIPYSLRLQLIEGALKEYYEDACEAVITIDGKEYSTVLLIDPAAPQTCDVLLKKKMIGSGGSAIAHQALSLRTLKYMVVKYPQELADPQEANNADSKLKKIAKHEGIQNRAKLFRLQRKEEYKQVALEKFYKNRDFASCVFGDLFCSKWNVSKDEQAVRWILGELDTSLQALLDKDLLEAQINKHLEAFIDEYGKIFTGVLGLERTVEHFRDYRSLITMAHKLKTVQAQAAKALQDEKRISTRDEAKGLVRNCMKKPKDFEVLLVDKELLGNLLSREHEPDLECAIRDEAKTVMQKLIRKYQADIVRRHIQNSNLMNEDPLQWEKGANQPGFRDKHLDLKGINAITRKLGMDFVIDIKDECIQKEKENLNKICTYYLDLQLDSKLEDRLIY